jgi:hypothetical protein
MTIQADGLLAALIIFLSPVVAIDEPLAVYRIHGGNLYFQSGQSIDKDRQARRISTLRIILNEMDKWLLQNSYDLNQPEILAFRRRWQLLHETEEFLLQSPGRLTFCLHLLRAMINMNPCLNFKIQAVNLLNAIGSLAFGYEHYTRLDDWRKTLMKRPAGAERESG